MTRPLAPLPPIALSPTGGLAEDQGKYLPVPFHQLDNLVFTKVGQVEKRHGYGNLGGVSTFADVSHVAVRLDELVAITTDGGAGSVVDPGHYLYSYASGADAWIARTPVPRTALTKRYPLVRSAAELSTRPPQVARVGDVEMTLYSNDGESYVRVTDALSGTCILADTTINTGSIHVRLFVSGTRLVLVWVTAGGDVKCLSYNVTTLAFGTTFSVVALGAAASVWDAVPLTSGVFCLAARVAGNILVKRVDSTTGTVTHSTTELGEPGIKIGLAYLSGHAFVAMTWDDDVTADLWCKKYVSTTLATAVAAWQVAAVVDPAIRAVSVGIEAVTFNVCCGWTDVGLDPFGEELGFTRFRSFLANGTALGAAVTVYRTALQTQIFPLGGACYALVCDYYSTVDPDMDRLFGYALICLSRHPEQWDGSRPVALEGHFAPLDGRGIDASAAGDMLPIPSLADATTVVLPISVLKDRALSDGGGFWADALELSAEVPGPGLWRSDVAQNLLHLTAAITTQYDTQCASEIGFLQPPQILDATQVYGATGLEGSMVSYTEYQYYAIWEWRDAVGNIHRSRRSALFLWQVSNGGGFDHAVVTLSISTTGLTRRTDLWAGDLRSIRLKVYRNTPVSGAITSHYQVAWDDNFNVASDALVEVVDDEDDDALIAANRGQIYTDGGVADNDTPPSARHVVTHGGRVWLTSAEAREIWFSKYLVSGEAPAFSALMRVTLDDSPDAPVACAPLGSQLAIFTTSRIYLLAVNPGPGDTGAPAYSAPDAIQTSWGCTDARSVLKYRDGVAFKSRDGLRLLTLGGDVVPLGDAARDHLADYPTILGAVLDEERMRLLFLCASSGDRTIVLCWDYRHQAWTSWSWAAEIELAARAHCLWQGQHIQAAHGDTLDAVWCESYGAYPGQDPGPNDLPVWITATVETPWVHLGAIGGYQRLWRVQIQLEANSPYGLAVSFFVDGDDTTSVQDETWTVTQMGALDTGARQPIQIGVKVQKCSTVKLRIVDTETAIGIEDDPTGFVYHETALFAAGKPGLAQLPAGNLR